VIKLPVYDEDGKAVDRVEFDESVLGRYVHRQLLHQAVVMYEANKRVGTANAKKRDEVSHSGAKPWRQKGTGRARQGDRRSPIWRGGGAAWGPRPRDYRQDLPKKARRRALRSALLSKFKDNEVTVIRELSFDEPKTKRMARILEKLGIEGWCLVAPKERSDALYRSVRNLRRTRILPLADLNAYEVLRAGRLLLTREALEALPERFASRVAPKAGA